MYNIVTCYTLNTTFGGPFWCIVSGVESYQNTWSFMPYRNPNSKARFHCMGAYIRRANAGTEFRHSLYQALLTFRLLSTIKS